MDNNDISNSKSSTKLNGTKKNDYIYNEAHHVTITAGKGNDTVELAPGSSRCLYKYANGDGNDTIIGFDNFTEGVIQLTSGKISNYTINPQTNDHVIKIGKGSITLKNIKTDKVAIKTKTKNYRYINGKAFNDPNYNGDNFYTNDPVKGTTDNDYINVGGDKVTINADSGDDYVNIDNNYANKYFIINGGEGNDTLSNIGSYSTFVGGLGDDIIHNNSFGAVIKYINGDGNDTIYGYNSTDTIKIFNSNYTTLESGQDVIINVGIGKMILKEAKDETLNIQTNTANLSDLYTITLSNKNKLLYTSTSNIGLIDASKRSKATRIFGNDNNNSIVGGTNKDTLIGSGGNDTLTGGKGKDIFVYSSGDDVITDYTSAQDKVKLDGADITGFEIVNSDIKLSTNKGNLTLEKVKGKKVTITNSSNKSSAYIFDSGSINGSRAKEIIYGSDGNDTINAGKGNDTLYGGGGADTFFYTLGDGNDVIADFASGDVIKFGSSKTKVNVKKSRINGNDYILAIGSNTIKLMGAANQSIKVIDYAGNSQTYNEQNTSAELFIDDNFIDSGLDSILETNLAVPTNQYEEKVSNEKILVNDAGGSILCNKFDLCNTARQGNNVDNN